MGAVDLCEIWRNSVLQSWFPIELQMEWFGAAESKDLWDTNDVDYTNVPNLRFKFRRTAHKEEWSLIRDDEWECLMT